MRTRPPLLLLTAVAALALAAPPALPADAPPANADLVRTARSGPWSAPSTREGARVPAAGARVQIREGHTVLYDVNSDQGIRALHIAGTVTFAPDRDTRLDVCLIKIQPGDDTSEEGFDCTAHLGAHPADGPRPTATTAKGVPIYLHDYFGPGRDAEVLSTKTREWREERDRYREEPLLTGDESRVTEVHDVPFPHLLDPLDDLPSATVITHVAAGAGRVVVRGTTSDNGTVKRVLVNGREARALAENFAEWEAVLPDTAAGELKLTAHAEDAAGNVEQLPHVVAVDLPR